jgi:serine/threonine-protein kinase
MNPEKIGRYIIISELGRGGMATVYRAKDPNFDREVAVKILPRTFLHDPQFRARFEREAKTVAALEHAAIVPVYDFGEEDGQPYIVMRLMSGGSLADKLKEGKFSLEEAVRIISHLAAGLDAAHRKGVIHRDLKPGNILFDQYNDPYLSDFGIARLAEGDSTLTGSRILGTPAYMSPEQIQGDKDIDGRSDIYAMGVIFYQMLVGNTPFQAATPAKIMMMHILEPIPNILKSLPTVPTSIENWFERVLAKDPEERFPNANNMGESLTKALRGESPATPEMQQTVIAQPPDENATQRSRPITTPPPRQSVPPIRQQVQAEPVSHPVVQQGPPELYTPPPAPTARKSRFTLPVILGGLVVVGIVGVGLIYLVFSGLNGSGPLASVLASEDQPISTNIVASLDETPLPTDTPQVEENQPEVVAPTSTEVVVLPTATVPPPTPSPAPTAIPTQAAVVIGGADKIAFLKANDVWLMNVDGSELEKLTNDGAQKSELGWMPDGSAIYFISGKCIWSLNIDSQQVDTIACFESAEYLETFAISPDGAQVAISLNREMYVVPFDLAQLKSVKYNYDLADMATCASVAPMKTSTGTAVPIKQFRWANDSQRFVILKLANAGGQLVDLIQMFDLQSCSYEPIRQDEIPSSRFTIENYHKTPYLQNFGYDGNNLLAMVSYTRNDGYGHMYIYNHESYKADEKINPVGGECCYRDPEFSPDGSHLIFVYQPYEIDPITQLYFVSYGTIGSGATYEPLPLPELFFENHKEKPQPVLRPAP